VRITILVADYNLAGGGERVAFNLAGAFSEIYGHETQILSVHKLARPLPFSSNRDLKIQSLDLNLYHGRSIRQFLTKLLSLIRVRRFFGKENADIVLGIGVYSSVLLSFVTGQNLFRIGCEHSSFSAPHLYWRLIRRVSYPLLDTVVFLTERAMQQGKAVNKHREVIPNFSSFTPLCEPNLSSKRVIAVGRMDRNKAFDLLIDIFTSTVKTRPNWKLAIIGDGVESDNLRQHIQRLGISDSARILPSTREIKGEYLASAICAMTSHLEGFPMVLVEAQACGLPCVAYDCDAGPAEIISHGETGFLIQPGDRATFEAKLGELMDNPKMRRNFSVSAKKRSEKFSRLVVCDLWQKLFSSRNVT
jgi:glycosyltransferase involved in cell wall biosynthesis